MLYLPSLWGVAGFRFGSARINILGGCPYAVVRVAVQVGETNGMSARRRSGRSACLRPCPARKLVMNSASIVLIALAMSTDAFAAAVGKGAALHRPHLREALRTGLIFGVIEALTPVVGWGLGQVAAPYVSAWDHWIAFVLLGLLGLRMIREGLSAPEVETKKPGSHSFWILAITGFATSIDAMVVGVGLAFMDANIIVTAAAIGLATFTMVTLGVMLGRVLGIIVGKRAELAGGLILIGIGCVILYEHLGNVA
jgi:putative Mn2+ efflux pump MntP